MYTYKTITVKIPTTYYSSLSGVIVNELEAENLIPAAPYLRKIRGALKSIFPHNFDVETNLKHVLALIYFSKGNRDYFLTDYRPGRPLMNQEAVDQFRKKTSYLKITNKGNYDNYILYASYDPKLASSIPIKLHIGLIPQAISTALVNPHNYYSPLNTALSDEAKRFYKLIAARTNVPLKHKRILHCMIRKCYTQSQVDDRLFAAFPYDYDNGGGPTLQHPGGVRKTVVRLLNDANWDFEAASWHTGRSFIRFKTLLMFCSHELDTGQHSVKKTVTTIIELYRNSLTTLLNFQDAAIWQQFTSLATAYGGANPRIFNANGRYDFPKTGIVLYKSEFAKNNKAAAPEIALPLSWLAHQMNSSKSVYSCFKP